MIQLELFPNETPMADSSLSKQVAGNHYKDMKIQPVEFIHANGIPYMEGNAIKYLCRWRKKNGIADLEKARHYIDLLIELETHNARKTD
jgi:UDP-3-O-acyl-N-acetylglucosamine deacetylase